MSAGPAATAVGGSRLRRAAVATALSALVAGCTCGTSERAAPRDPCSPVDRTEHPGVSDSTLVVRERDGYAPGFAARWHVQGGRLIFPTQLERRRRASVQWTDVKGSVEAALGASHGARVDRLDHESFAVTFTGSCAAFLGALSQVPIVRQ